MKTFHLFAVLVTLPLLLGGCGEKEVNFEELEERESIWYLKDSETPYTGKVYSLHPNGQKKGEVNWKDGTPEGPATRWHKNGQKNTEGNWKDGKEDGLTVGWYENGQKEYEVNFKDGKIDGLVVKWHENGQMKVESNFKDGKMVEGSAKYWNRKGEPVDTIEEARK